MVLLHFSAGFLVSSFFCQFHLWTRCFPGQRWLPSATQAVCFSLTSRKVHSLLPTAFQKTLKCDLIGPSWSFGHDSVNPACLSLMTHVQSTRNTAIVCPNSLWECAFFPTFPPLLCYTQESPALLWPIRFLRHDSHISAQYPANCQDTRKALWVVPKPFAPRRPVPLHAGKGVWEPMALQINNLLDPFIPPQGGGV